MQEQFDEYRIIGPLGQGGMGQVYVARDTLLERDVAVKFINQGNDSNARARFQTEAKAIARLSHPNIVAIYRIGEVDGQPYLVSELIRGRSLDAIELPVEPQLLLRIALDLARALSAAHRQGVLHRDIKPANAILSHDGVTKLVDFGIAKLTLLPTNASAVTIPFDQVPADPNDNTGLIKMLHLPPQEVALAATLPPDEREQAVVVAANPLPLFAVPDEVKLAQAPTYVIPNSVEIAKSAAPREQKSNGASSHSNTHVGALMGTPQYMAPELWRFEPATEASDIYSLGALLYHLACGRTPRNAATLSGLRQQLEEPIVPTGKVASLDPEFSAVIDQCLADDLKSRFVSADALCVALEGIASSRAKRQLPAGNPYRGLLAFQAEHRDLFFGRKLEVRAILERLRIEPMVVVAGDSGVGKSSLVRAGILPEIVDGALGELHDWNMTTLTPGMKPLPSLLEALSHVLSEPDDDSEHLLHRLSEEFTLVGHDVRRRRKNRGAFIFIDQLEELVTLADPDEAKKVAELLARITTSLPFVRVLATVRSDFLSRVSALPGLRDTLSRALFLLPPLSPDSLKEAIIGPARSLGVEFSPELTQALVRTVDTPGSLPLLQFALAELWEARDPSNTLIQKDILDRLGGVDGALARHADGVLATLRPEQREVARQLFTGLVSASGTRALLSEDDLAQWSADGKSDGKAVMEVLVSKRLVSATESEHGATYEVSHEALLSSWPTLKRWLDTDANDRVVRERLALAAKEWQRLQFSAEVLWSEKQVGELKQTNLSELPDLSQKFWAASQKRVRLVRWRKSAIAVIILLAVAATYGGVRWKRNRDINRAIAVKENTAERLLSLADSVNSGLAQARQRTLALSQKEGAATYDLWQRIREVAAFLDQTYNKAGRALDDALALAPSRQDIRIARSEILYKRVLLAEKQEQHELVNEILQRLAQNDPDGIVTKKWEAPATVSIKTEPENARFSLSKFEKGENERLIARPIGEPFNAPVDALRLNAGSYLLVADAPGRNSVIYPFSVSRSQSLPVHLYIPKAEEVPDGFVYVPAGVSLIGSAESYEFAAKFFSNTPIHEVEIPSFLIAKHETTFAEWIVYLESLGPEEREQRMPRSNTGWGDVALSCVNQRCSFRMKPGVVEYSAGPDELIHYKGRTLRQDQDWHKFPVSGVSYEDAVAYAKWLDASDKLPGARLCNDFEWERAARGADRRKYPHGEELYPDDANQWLTYGGEGPGSGPDEVGSHPSSQSPFGVNDLSGNVYEFVTGKIFIDVSSKSIVRGGAFPFDRLVLRIENRQIAEPELRGLYVGVRICADFAPRN